MAITTAALMATRHSSHVAGTTGALCHRSNRHLRDCAGAAIHRAGDDERRPVAILFNLQPFFTLLLLPLFFAGERVMPRRCWAPGSRSPAWRWLSAGWAAAPDR
jgi:hypothetical protein